MFSAQRLLAENLRNGKYKIIKEGKFSNKIICYLSIDDGIWLFTNQSGGHQILPVLEFKHAISLTIKNGIYQHIARTALSLWTVREEAEQEKIIDMVESLVINNVIQVDS